MNTNNKKSSDDNTVLAKFSTKNFDYEGKVARNGVPHGYGCFDYPHSIYKGHVNFGKKTTGMRKYKKSGVVALEHYYYFNNGNFVCIQRFGRKKNSCFEFQFLYDKYGNGKVEYVSTTKSITSEVIVAFNKDGSFVEDNRCSFPILKSDYSVYVSYLHSYCLCLISRNKLQDNLCYLRKRRFSKM